ncbi:MAG: helicase [Gemmatimonadetes bacterium]|nr:helicase [Gemmatimonadota bacterium]
MTHGEPRIASRVASAIKTAIHMAGGREVCFVGTMDDDGILQSARAVARGDSRSVLALPGFAKRGEVLVHNHPSGVLEPSEADLDVAARLHGDGIGFAIVDNDAARLYVVVEVPRADAERPLDAAAVADLLDAHGPVAAHVGQFEDRPTQRDMAATIAALYSKGGIGLLEAGTGVGKSLAYLVPALRWAALNGERTVISTNTITLQEQLVGKDLPILAASLADQKVRFALLKGWHNYLCLQRLDTARAEGASLFEEGLADELDNLTAWAANTKDGSLSDLPTAPRSDLWDEVAAEGDLCTRMRCPHFDRCFVFAARRRAAEADVVVVNHHLLMADIAVRRASGNWTEAAVLPPFTRLVVDEGHHLEDAAAAHLGHTVSRRGLQRLFARLERRGKGLLPALEHRLARATDLLSIASLDLVRVRLVDGTRAAREKSQQVCDLLDAWLAARSEPQVRLTDAFDDDPIWHGGLGAALDDLLREIALLDDGLRTIASRLETEPARADELAPLLGEIRGVSRRLQHAGDALRGALRSGRDANELVRWLERRPGDGNVGAASVPLDLAPILREDLFVRLDTAIVTSATLATSGGFAFIARRLGLDDDRTEPVTRQFASPFDYPTQAVLAVPSDFVAPNADGRAHFGQVLSAAHDLIEVADGGVFVLFTSHRDVKQAAATLRALDVEARWPLLVHGEAPRDQLLQRFRDHGNAVLVGTSTFWEGVDVPGRALHALLLARIPFRVPSEPVTAAQCEAIEKAGGDSFMEYMVPHAALRLKQGFGRLVRSTADRGAVVLCDPRVLRKGYGAHLLDALPPARRAVAPWASLRETLRDFYANHRGAPAISVHAD